MSKSVEITQEQLEDRFKSFKKQTTELISEEVAKAINKENSQKQFRWDVIGIGTLIVAVAGLFFITFNTRIDSLNTRMDSLEKDIADLKVSTQADIADLKTSTQADIADLKTSTQADIERLEKAISEVKDSNQRILDILIQNRTQSNN